MKWITLVLVFLLSFYKLFILVLLWIAIVGIIVSFKNKGYEWIIIEFKNNTINTNFSDFNILHCFIYIINTIRLKKFNFFKKIIFSFILCKIFFTIFFVGFIIENISIILLLFNKNVIITTERYQYLLNSEIHSILLSYHTIFTLFKIWIKIAFFLGKIASFLFFYKLLTFEKNKINFYNISQKYLINYLLFFPWYFIIFLIEINNLEPLENINFKKSIFLKLKIKIKNDMINNIIYVRDSYILKIIFILNHKKIIKENWKIKLNGWSMLIHCARNAEISLNMCTVFTPVIKKTGGVVNIPYIAASLNKTKKFIVFTTKEEITTENGIYGTNNFGTLKNEKVQNFSFAIINDSCFVKKSISKNFTYQNNLERIEDCLGFQIKLHFIANHFIFNTFLFQSKDKTEIIEIQEKTTLCLLNYHNNRILHGSYETKSTELLIKNVVSQIYLKEVLQMDNASLYLLVKENSKNDESLRNFLNNLEHLN